MLPDITKMSDGELATAMSGGYGKQRQLLVQALVREAINKATRHVTASENGPEPT